MTAQRLLVVEDEVHLAEVIADNLELEGWAVDVVGDGLGALEHVRSSPPDLILLDVMLPGASGFEILRRLRARSRVPVLMLTARGDDVDRIVGLEMGADDYLPKPFNPRELVARIRAVLRRAQAAMRATPERIEVGDVVLDTGARTVRRDGEEVRLTAVEFDVLEQLMRNAGVVVSREQLTQDVLDREYSALDRSIDMHVSNLRRKLGAEHEGVERIKTIRGVGYVYTRPATGSGDVDEALRSGTSG